MENIIKERLKKYGIRKMSPEDEICGNKIISSPRIIDRHVNLVLRRMHRDTLYFGVAEENSCVDE